ncbi:hypothetical protein VII00023_08034 [Vibrio ichthyoenteri ATCC 700023]|uniref:Peptidase C58 YopT-type domain-containing protein n=1 Tax=Vibrio ichthyoenteri ATCC 700023 TaxID=870968 RepID=F9RZW8_9VIBR|nr:YopT-type cysteine protease domain-containing protein [Vibrio ichthyoenteri]EGU44191.1 hypothetical protein VII00023_08034 [Vibrio ichthyoenteri ATCC 700023]
MVNISYKIKNLIPQNFSFDECKKLSTMNVVAIKNININRLNKTLKTTRNENKKNILIEIKERIELLENNSINHQRKNGIKLKPAKNNINKFNGDGLSLSLTSKLGINGDILSLGDLFSSLMRAKKTEECKDKVYLALKKSKKEIVKKEYDILRKEQDLPAFKNLTKEEKKHLFKECNSLLLTSDIYRLVCNNLLKDNTLLNKIVGDDLKSTCWNQKELSLINIGQSRGLCFGLVMGLASHLKQNGDVNSYIFKLNSKSISVRNEITDLQLSQILNPCHSDYIAKQGVKSSLKFGPSILTELGYVFNEFFDSEIKVDADFNVFIIEKKSKQAHALVAYSEVIDGNENFVFFDPNYGFMSFNSKRDMEIFINIFISTIYYEYETKKTYSYWS